MYSKKLLEKFKNIKSESTNPNLLDSVSTNSIFNNDIENKSKINEIDSNKNTVNLNNNMNINYPNNNNEINFSSQINIKSSLFQPQNNFISLGNNCIYNNYTGIIPNSQKDIFMNQIPNILSAPNNLNLNGFYNGPNGVQNNFKNDMIPNLYLDIDNKNSLEPANIPFLQLPLQNQNSIVPISNNVVSNNNFPNNFLITNNTNINTNSNINKNINDNINFEQTKIISTNINNNNNSNRNIQNLNNINKNSHNKLKINNVKIENNNNIIDKEKSSNTKININAKIIFSSKIYNNYNINKINVQPKTKIENTSIKKATPLFNVKETSLIKEKSKKIQLCSKKRKRFIKNNKLVFVQVDQEKEKEINNIPEESEENEESQNHDSLNSEKMSELIQKNKKPRGSRYRGVSKNGTQWQVLIMVNKKKRYLGSFSSEEEAARAYDKVALQHHGIKAKTNYEYTKEEIKKIMNEPKLLNLE